jgi:hypothetical protein
MDFGLVARFLEITLSIGAPRINGGMEIKMSNLTDSGCRQHQAQQVALTGATASLVGHLIVNLPLTGDGHTYICEHGYTHRLTLEPCDNLISLGACHGMMIVSE